MDERLKQSEERYRSLFEYSPVSLWEEDWSGPRAYLQAQCLASNPELEPILQKNPDIVKACLSRVRLRSINQATKKLFHVSGIDDLKKTPQDKFDPAMLAMYGRWLAALCAGVTQVREQEISLQFRGGIKHLSFQLQLIPGCEESWDKVLISVVDNTGRKCLEEDRLEMERRMLQAQKLESLGALAGGIAHDFNNLLMVIQGNLDLLIREMDASSASFGLGEQALLACRKAADLSRQMLAYSGGGQREAREIGLCALIEESAALLRASVSKRATLKLQLERDTHVFLGDPAQVHQVILNLVINASEAIDSPAGTITIRTGSRAFCSKQLQESRLPDKPDPGLFAFVEVTDTGCGMEAETQRRLFEPFFSTKFTGRGLGMATVLGVARSHRGAIFVVSEKGKGSTIRVLFPIQAGGSAPGEIPSGGAVPDSAPREKTAASPTDVSRTILVVDDEAQIRGLCQAMLEQLGYRVRLASDGEEALSTFQRLSGEIACVLLDLTMPRMDGVATFAALRKIRPDVKVVLSSGYGEQETLERFPAKALSGFIQKPFSLAMLKAALERALGS